VTGFTYHRRSRRVIGSFPGFEADLLRSLASQMVELLRSESALPNESGDPLAAMFDFSGPTTLPEDPVLARLFPNAYEDDEESAGEFRRFTESALRDRKAANASVIVDTLDEAGLPDEPDDDISIDLELDQASATAWMTALTDIRLALATRLGVEEDDEDRWVALPEEDPARQVYAIYHWTGFLQETLVEALSKAVAHG
jgi:hypothetical protein